MSLKDVRTQYFEEFHDKVGISLGTSESELLMQLLDKDGIRISARFIESKYMTRRDLLYNVK